MLQQQSAAVRQYLVVTGNYWAFTLTDGALRMLVVLHFHGLGYSPLDIALLFLFYEIFGVITNLAGGWLGAYLGLNRTMQFGLIIQVIALSMLLVPAAMLTVPWVMAAQALSGIAKDLNKMSAKSSIKLLVPADAQNTLYKWVAILTGSKNALKGAGFFLGGLLLATFGFTTAVLMMAVALALVWTVSLVLLKQDIGKTKARPKFRDVLSKSRAINILSAARMLLFGARDVWFVVALPVFLSQSLNWNHNQTGGFLALWVIGYGAVQAYAPRLTGASKGLLPDGKAATLWAAALTLLPILIALALAAQLPAALVLVGGLLLFGVVFAINSSMHSYLIVSFAGSEGVSLDVGFYYMANAAGRLLGTVLSGWVFQLAGQGAAGLAACLWISAAMLAGTVVISYWLPKAKSPDSPLAT